jgi:hypothetical protein
MQSPDVDVPGIYERQSDGGWRVVAALQKARGRLSFKDPAPAQSTVHHRQKLGGLMYMIPTLELVRKT